MNNYEKIIDATKNGDVIHTMMLNSTKDEILKANIPELATLINTRMEKAPCDFYCHNCGEKGVLLSHCQKEIVKYLEEIK